MEEKCKNKIKKVKKDILVLSGGSIRGIAHIGALKALEDKKLLVNIKTIAGSSIGGIVGALYIFGYSPDELIEFIKMFDLEIIKNIRLELMLTDFGVDKGENLRIIIEKMMEAKDLNKDITFKELYEKTNKKLIVTGVCVNDKKEYDFSYETYPDMPVIVGLRITSSIPFLFTPVKFEDKFFIDGGIMNNYPINLFTKKINRVIGIYLEEVKDNVENICNLETYLINIVSCIFGGVALALVRNYEKQTIVLRIPKTCILDMGEINSDVKNLIYNLGYNETIKFIDNMRV